MGEMAEYDRKTEEIVRELSQEAEKQIEVDPHEDRTREFVSTSFTRMRWERRSEEAAAIEGLHQVIERRMWELFGGAYQVMNDLYMIVREPQVTIHGEILTDEAGFYLWAVNEHGNPIEDYTRLGYKEREHFLFAITTNLFAWEQAAASLWGDSMFAKAIWEEAVATGYEASKANGGKTVEDRIQAARLVSREPRYQAIFETVISKRADALIKSLQLIGQRLKDVLSS
jgi:hypothetical protein